MRVRTAIPILATAFTIMLLGLSLASAQQQPPEHPVRPPLPGLRPALKIRRPLADRGLAKRNRPPLPRTDGQPATPAASDPPGAEPGHPVENTTAESDPACRPMNRRARVTFNLEDSDLSDLIRLISNITCKRFILPGGKAQRDIKATIVAPTKVNASEAYSAFLSILSANGMTVVPVGRYLKIISTTGAETNPLPMYRPGSATPGDERWLTRMYRVENVAAEDVVTLITRFKSADGNISAYAPTNVVIMTDTGANIRRMVRVIETVDVPAGGEQVWIEPVHHADVSDLAERLKEIFPVGAGTGAAATTAPARPGRATRRPGRPAAAAASNEPSTVGSSSGSRISNILADERTNSLIIMATEQAYLQVLEMIRYLDVPVAGEGDIHVQPVQNGDAEDLADALNSLISGGGSSASHRPTKGRTKAPSRAGGTSIFEGQIRVTAHAATNSLIITSSAHDYQALRRVIEQLDAPRRQVFIEAVIMELSVRRTSDLGLTFHGGIANAPTQGSIMGFGTGLSTLSSIADPSLLQGLAVGLQGPEIPDSASLVGLSIPAFGVAMHALGTSSDTNVLSTPHIIAMDNEEAVISVGENVPLQTAGIGTGGLSSLSSLAGGANAAANPLASLAGGFNTALPRQDVGVTITITPHINDANEIRMDINQEVSELGDRDGALGAASINKRSAKTKVMVRDQQTVVIGGMIRETTQTGEQKIPILGDIPLLGALFRRTTTTKTRRNLLLFLTPYIIRDPSDLRSIFERKMQERQEFIDRYFVFGDQDYEPLVDWSRTRGLVSEIANELDSIQADREALENARAHVPPQHVPRSPVGSASVNESRAVFERGDLVIEPDRDDPAGVPPPPPEFPLQTPPVAPLRPAPASTRPDGDQ